jgi:putative transcription factor
MFMRCEVCGRRILGRPQKVVIEGARMTVCTACSKHGKLTWEEEPKPKAVVKPKGPRQPTKLVTRNAPETPPPESTFELIEGFDSKIRQAREKMGISHEDLGKKLNEKVSRLKKIEIGKMTPDNLLAAKLEHALKIKLIVPASEEKTKTPTINAGKRVNRELTLGDLIKLDEKKAKPKADKGEPAARERS